MLALVPPKIISPLSDEPTVLLTHVPPQTFPHTFQKVCRVRAAGQRKSVGDGGGWDVLGVAQLSWNDIPETSATRVSKEADMR